MNSYVTGDTIKSLRLKNGFTQNELAGILSVSDKAISKWETGRGLPDISLLEPLSKALKVSVAELLSGNCIQNNNKSANIKKGSFYVCPVCGNVIFASGNASISCCGITLPPLIPEESDEKHLIKTEIIENEQYVTVSHPMTKEHYISFLAKVTTDSVVIRKLYPQQDASAYFPMSGKGTFYLYCNKHGLIKE